MDNAKLAGGKFDPRTTPLGCPTVCFFLFFVLAQSEWFGFMIISCTIRERCNKFFTWLATSLTVIARKYTSKEDFHPESLGMPNYLYQISFPRSIKTSKCNKTCIMLNFVMSSYV